MPAEVLEADRLGRDAADGEMTVAEMVEIEPAPVPEAAPPSLVLTQPADFHQVVLDVTRRAARHEEPGQPAIPEPAELEPLGGEPTWQVTGTQTALRGSEETRSLSPDTTIELVWPGSADQRATMALGPVADPAATIALPVASLSEGAIPRVEGVGATLQPVAAPRMPRRAILWLVASTALIGAGTGAYLLAGHDGALPSLQALIHTHHNGSRAVIRPHPKVKVASRAHHVVSTPAVQRRPAARSVAPVSATSWTFPAVGAPVDQAMLLVTNPNKFRVDVRVGVAGKNAPQLVRVPAASGLEMDLVPRTAANTLVVRASAPIMAQRLLNRHGVVSSSQGRPSR